MTCLFSHSWGWPRKRGERDVQVCIRCGSERDSRVQFDGPRYRMTQEGIPALPPATAKVRHSGVSNVTAFPSVA